MQVKTGELKNHLSRFLKRVAQTGEAITILDRNRPVARLMPLARRGKADGAWEKARTEILDRASRLGIKIRLTDSEPPSFKSLGVLPRLAPDGRQDIETVANLRKEKDY